MPNRRMEMSIMLIDRCAVSVTSVNYECDFASMTVSHCCQCDFVSVTVSVSVTL